MSQPKVLITSVQVPFTRGGAEILVDMLKREVASRGYKVDVIQLPFYQERDDLIEVVNGWRRIDERLLKEVDLVICTKFPTYFTRHPKKVTWLIHQHRQMYELWGGRYSNFHEDETGEAIRQNVVAADSEALLECQRVYTISENVTKRLHRFNGIESSVLLPPLPQSDRYHTAKPEKYILSVGRLCLIKRVDLLIKSLPMIDGELKLKIVGVPDEPMIESYLNSEIRKHNLQDRIEFCGKVSDEALLDLYARSFAVFYAPFDEDYGFVTLEALRSSKPVVTANDSGGVLAFIRHLENGLIAEPNERSIAEAFNRLYSDSELYSALCSRAASSFETNNWDEIVEKLTAPIRDQDRIAANHG